MCRPTPFRSSILIGSFGHAIEDPGAKASNPNEEYGQDRDDAETRTAARNSRLSPRGAPLALSSRR